MFAAARSLNPTRVLKKLESVKSALERIDSEVKLQHYKIRNFKPNVTFSYERGNFIVKTAETGSELEACLKLRFEVFHREYMNKKRTFGIDIDKLDFNCDHLMIVDKRTSKVIGTYRLNCSLFTDEFYSTSEFQMEKLLQIEGAKLELGRACIDKEFRNGVVIALLWRGISEYIQRTSTKVMFGCGSIKTMEPLQIGLITHHLLEKGHLSKEYGVTPTRKYKVRQLDRVLEYIEANPFEYDEKEINGLIPPLVQAYFKLGAKVVGEPALDREFHCIDFLTVLKVDELSQSAKGKYNI